MILINIFNKMKSIFLCLILVLSVIKAGAIEFYTYEYNFSNFKHYAGQGIGSSLASKENTLSNMFIISAQLNAYIQAKVANGKLKNKPVIYDICGYEFERKRFLIELYETDKAYHISVNNEDCNYFSFYFTFSELIQIVDYFASPDFKPIYTNSQKVLTQQIQINTIPKDFSNITIYSSDDIQIKYIDKKINVFWEGNNLGIELNAPISPPIKLNDRIIIIDNRHLYILEKGRIIKKVKVDFILTGEVKESNIPNMEIYDYWLNFKDYHGTNIYSYSYKENKLYKLFSLYE